MSQFFTFTRKVLCMSQQLSRRIAFNKSLFVHTGARCCSSTTASPVALPSPEDVNKTLMEFFDVKTNWGENEVKHGRNWLLPELRIKSNQDLHKLWFILLKERNMLLTMEHEAKQQHRLFPSAERLDKIRMSMENLETVVRERNCAYNELETGETGERPGKLIRNQFGIAFFYRSFEHRIPFFMNIRWRNNHLFRRRGSAVTKFLSLYRETLWNKKRKALNRERNEVIHLLKRNPDLDRQLLQKRFPAVNIDRLQKLDKFRGHHVPNL